jgi:hypothetical protein
MKKEIYNKIISKKEFSQLPRRDVEVAFERFDKRSISDEEKIRLTRELLHKVFSSFVSRKILSPKDKDVEWILRKHLSTRERLPYYDKLYGRILKNIGRGISVYDLGAGINGFSYNYMKKFAEINYFAIEAVGQLVDLMNTYFKKEKISGRAVHISLFELEKIKIFMKKQRGKKIVFLFKVLDSLEMLEKDYSKKLLLEIVPLAEKVVVSFATRSFVKRRKFKVKRNWIIDFIRDNFGLIEDFELDGERYLVLEKSKSL